MHAGAQNDRASTLVVGRENARAPEDHRTCWKIGPRNDLAQLVDRDLGVVEMRNARVDHLAEVVRRDVGRHADRDAAGTIDQQVRKGCRENHRLPQGSVVVLAEVDGLFVEVVEQALRDFRQTALGVTVGGGRIAIDGTEIALTVDQGDAHREILRHAHERIIDRKVTMRVVFAHRLADDAGALHVLLVPVEAEFLHRKEDAAMHWLQAVPHVGQRAGDDYAHGVVEVAPAHLVGNGHRADVVRPLGAGSIAGWFVVVGQGSDHLRLNCRSAVRAHRSS